MRPAALFDVVSLALPLLLLLQGLADRFAAYLQLPLNADMPGWLANARQAQGLYEAGDREPLHALALRLGLWLFDGEQRAARLTTALETALLLVAAWWLARVLAGRAAAFVVAVVLALNETVLHYALWGLREPLQTALGVACVAAAMVLVQRPTARRLALAAVLVAALCLTRRYSALLGFGALGSVVLLLPREQWRAATKWVGACALVAVGLLLPRAFVDGGHGGADLAWFIEHNRATLGIAPGPPLPTSLVEALFEGRDVVDVVVLLLSNLVSYLTGYLPFLLRDSGPLWMLCAAGLLANVVVGRGVLALCFLLAVAPFLPLYHLNPEAGRAGVEVRFALPPLPFVLLAGVDLLRRALRWALLRRGRSSLVDEWLVPVRPS